MFSPRLFRIAGSLVAGAALTAALFHLDVNRAVHHQTQEALKWARQMAAQAEGMVFSARTANFSEDPLEWAVSFLTQGTEPRAMRMTKVRRPDSFRQFEQHRLDPRTGTFEYVRIFLPETGEGVRIETTVAFPGFLGTRTRFTSDLALGAVFLVTSLFLLSLSRRPQPKNEEGLKSRVASWAWDARNLLNQLGSSIRDMTRNARDLAVAAGHSRQALENLRSRMHQNLGTLHRQLKLLRSTDDPAHGALRKLEAELETWVTDADLAFHAYDGVFEAAEKMNKDIRRTTDGVLAQARIIQSLNENVQAPPRQSATRR